MSLISEQELKQALPEHVKKNVTPQLLQRVNQTLNDPEAYDTYRENLLGYAHVLMEGKFKMTNYVDAVKYISYKLMGRTNKDAFTLVFPEKITKWDADGVESKDQASYITAYNASKLVNLIYAQTLVPVHILNKDIHQQAINTQAELMLTAKSEKVRCDAANSLLTHLKAPETHKLELAVTHGVDSGLEALRQSTAALVAQQQQMLKEGTITAAQLANQNLIIDGDSVPLEN